MADFHNCKNIAYIYMEKWNSKLFIIIAIYLKKTNNYEIFDGQCRFAAFIYIYINSTYVHDKYKCF